MAVVVVDLEEHACAPWPGKLFVYVMPATLTDDGIDHLSRPLVLNDEGRG